MVQQCQTALQWDATPARPESGCPTLRAAFQPAPVRGAAGAAAAGIAFPLRLQVVLVLLDLGGRLVALPVSCVQDVVKVQRAGPGKAWRAHLAAVSAICPAGMLAVGDRCVQLLELSDWLGMAPARVTRRLRSVVVVQSGEHVVGLLSDAVTDVVETPGSAVAPAPAAADQHPALRQIAHLDAGVVPVLDVDRLLTMTGHSLVRQRG